MLMIFIFAMVYFAAGCFTVKFMFENEKAKFSDKVATCLLWPVLAFTLLCIAIACFGCDRL